MPGSEGGSAQDDAVDPRYDPRFQRGYDPEAHRAPATRRPGPVAPSGIPAAVAPPAAGSQDADPRRPDAEPILDPAGPFEDDGDAGQAPRNPFVIVLVLLGLACLGTSTALFAGFATGGFYSTSSFDTWTVFADHIRRTAPSPLLVSGLVSIFLAIALHAAGRDSR